MLTTTKENLKELYEEDFLLWIEKTIKLLSDRAIEDLDYDNLIEELATLGRSEKRTVVSLIKQLLIHLLLYQYWTTEHDRNANHWRAEIINFKQQLRDELRSKTIYNYAITQIDNLYIDALKIAKNKSNLKSLPSQCPYTFAQIIDENWLPLVSE